jgi:peptidoglycan L-alanyl-D-glutamate endopeptidase CwlK
MGYEFGATSTKNLSEAHVDLQAVFNEVIRHTDCKIIEGHRPKEEQNRAYEAGKSRVKWPNSKHNPQPAKAVDAVPWPLDWTDYERFKLFGGFVMWVGSRLWLKDKIKHLVRWGADWDDDGDIMEHSLVDYPHYELVEPGEAIYRNQKR